MFRSVLLDRYFQKFSKILKKQDVTFARKQSRHVTPVYLQLKLMLFWWGVWVLPTNKNLKKWLRTAAKSNLHIFRDLENFLEL